MTMGVFGTDGVRGRVGEQITGSLCWWIGLGAARALGPGVVAVARDTRPSGPALSQAVIAGVRAGGADVIDLGIAPTPALAWMVRQNGYAGGVMVTASHNLAEDNGCKVLMRGGDKADAGVREVIEAQLAASRTPFVPGQRGRLLPGPGLDGWQPFRGVHLDGLRVVLDAANGAAHWLGAERLRAAGAVVTVLGDGDGRLINSQCGATDPARLSDEVLTTGADLGIALDGDADRLALVIRSDRTAIVLDGDAMLWVLAGGLGAGDAVVGTIMSNLGLEQGLRAAGVRFVRTPVGDAEVWDGMVASGARFGGEPSGHLMFRGDASDPVGSCGLTTTARVLALGMDRVRERLAGWKPAVQRHGAVRISDAAWIATGDPGGGIKALVAARVAPLVAVAEGRGARVVVRPSGTEPIIRVMVEHAEPEFAELALSQLTDLLTRKGP